MMYIYIYDVPLHTHPAYGRVHQQGANTSCVLVCLCVYVCGQAGWTRCPTHSCSSQALHTLCPYCGFVWGRWRVSGGLHVRAAGSELHGFTLCPTHTLTNSLTHSVSHALTVPHTHSCSSQADGKELKEGEEVTLMDWGNAFVRNVTKDSTGTHPTLTCCLCPAAGIAGIHTCARVMHVHVCVHNHHHHHHHVHAGVFLFSPLALP